MNPEKISILADIYYEKMISNYQSPKNLKIIPDNVFQKGITHNYDLFMELVNTLMLPDSRVEGAEHLLKTLDLIKQNQSVLFLMKHAGNFDVPCFYALLSSKGSRYQDILDRLVFIAGRKLNEDSIKVKTFSEIFNRLIIVPNREIPPKAQNETTDEAKKRVAVLDEAVRINRAALRTMIRLKKDGYIIVLFPMGGRPKPWLNERGVKETTSYMKLFDFIHFIGMKGNLLPVGPEMRSERSRRDTIIFSVSEPIRSKAYLEESYQLFNRQKSEPDFDQFNVDRVMLHIGQNDK